MIRRPGRPLTDRQTEVLVMVINGLDVGTKPLLRGVAARLGITPSTAHKHIDALTRKGYLDRQGYLARGRRDRRWLYVTDRGRQWHDEAAQALVTAEGG